MRGKDKTTTTFKIELIMLVAGYAMETSYAKDASELDIGLEYVVLLMKMRVGTSHALDASELVVSSSDLVAESPIKVKIRICGSQVENLKCGLTMMEVGHPQQRCHLEDSGGPGDQGTEQDGKCDAGVLGVNVHAGQQSHHDVGAPSGQEKEHGLGHRGRSAGEEYQGHQCGGGQGGSDLGYFRGGQGSGHFRNQYETSSTFLSSLDVTHAALLCLLQKAAVGAALDRRGWLLDSCCAS